MSFGGGSGSGGSLAGSGDVFLSSPSDKQVLEYSTSSAKWQNASLASVASTGDYNDLLNKPTAAQSITTVIVTTGNETRPTATTVLWMGGTTQPTNMQTGDLWFTPTSPLDSTPPSVPTGLASSNITATSFSLSWSPASDNVGATGYEIQLNGISYNIVSGTSVTISGRSANTTYTCAVRARDAAGNWSAYSAGFAVTTLSSGSTEHTIFAQAVYPGALLKYTDASPITVATQFYTGNSGTTGWKVKGMRFYAPSGITLPSTCDVYLFNPGGSYSPDLSAPSASATLSVATGQWNEVNFASSITVSPGQAFWIGYRFADTSYLSTSSVGSNAIQASDGSQVFMAMDGGSLARNLYRIGNGSTAASQISGQGYGIDVIISET